MFVFEFQSGPRFAALKALQSGGRGKKKQHEKKMCTEEKFLRCFASLRFIWLLVISNFIRRLLGSKMIDLFFSRLFLSAE